MDKKSNTKPSDRRELKLKKRVAHLEELTIELHHKVNLISMVVKQMLEKVGEHEAEKNASATKDK
jgi:hypothetical protein